MKRETVERKRRKRSGERARKVIVWDDVLNLRIDLETLSIDELYARYFTIAEGAADRRG